ncbi:MAG: hypothetical protein RL637_1457 [Pseudomonadota bacterium]
MKMNLNYALILLLSLTVSPFVSAESVIPDTEADSYAEQVSDQAVHGLTNIGSAVLEIPKSMVNATNESNVALGVIGGLTKGILHTAGRFASGVVELVTAPILTKPIAQPAKIWEDFDTETTYGPAFRLERENAEANDNKNATGNNGK